LILRFFVAWISGNVYEWAIFEKRAIGPYAFYFWTMVFCNCVFPLLFWSKRIRYNILVSSIICFLINVGMWFERYNIVMSGLAEDFIPGSWGHYEPRWEIIMSFASFGWFFMWFLIFCKFFPIVSLSEIKLIMPKPLNPKRAAKGAH
jgi:molybdopterin-containing oxidoreductase family membrane subunit